MPGTTLIRNRHGQENVSVIQPPTNGPTVGASTARTPAIVVAIVWSRGGKSRKTAENTTGIRTPPAKPWKTRQRIRAAKLPLLAQPIEAIVNNATAITNSHRRGQQPRQEAAERNGDDFRDQIRGLDPTDLFLGEAQRTLDRRQRRGDHLDVEIAMNMARHIIANPIQTEKETGPLSESLETSAAGSIKPLLGAPNSRTP